jgi:hypothetical protein
MTTTAYSQEAPTRTSRYISAWHRLLAVITDGPTPTAEDAIAAYLHRHQDDLSPALWIEFERRHLLP